ncbi:MAG: error-prone DNA polymerase [Deltaproteobacteria bacterium]|nr:error-prone DNA polymerase [Deltaproteobacteria bacterium]
MAPRVAPYVPLWVKSNYSFLEGGSHPEELVARSHELGLPALPITDRDGVYGLVRAHVKAQELGAETLCGAQVTVEREGEFETEEAGRGLMILLARTRKGYGAMCRLLSEGQQRCPKGEGRVTADAARRAGAGDGLVALFTDAAMVREVAPAYGDGAYALVTRHLSAREIRREQDLRAAAALLGVEVVAGQEVLYHERKRRPVQDVLVCIRHGVTLSGAGTRIRENAEHAIATPAAFRELYADDPASVDRTIEVAARCSFRLRDLDYRYPAEAPPEGYKEQGWLEHLAFEGARRRYPDGVPVDVTKQLKRELGIIGSLEYGGYFLTMHEIVEWCGEQGILCQGRGSAANSAVCFCLGITAIDPVRMDLLFERFMSRERGSPPDIDLDIEHSRREEVIQHVYERYGRRHAAMVANVIRYRARSAVRDVGKVLGFPATDLDGIARLLGHYSGTLDLETLGAAGLDVGSPAVRQLLAITAEILDFPRHLSIHPGGFLLGAEPVDTLVPIEPATMEGRTVIQWDKQDVEDLGLFKVDLLGLGCLTAVRRSFALLRDHGVADLSIATVPAEDPATYAMCTKGDTVGVFQIESRAQMAMLPRLKPKTFYDLVIEVAIVRPGPIQGDMVHPYLRRRKGEEEVSYPHPCLERVLDKTLGVPIFQEQVMKLAVVAADYTPGEADQLRRDMAAWRSKGRIEQHRERLVGRMMEKGIPQDFAERVFSQIEGFGEYGFPESHAASFALLAYVTSWLKCHHPGAFACGMLNAQPMGFYSPSTLIEDVRRHGVRVRPVDVQESRWDSTLERDEESTGGFALRVGLRQVSGLGEREKGALEGWSVQVRAMSASREHRQALPAPREAASRLGTTSSRSRLGQPPAAPSREHLEHFVRTTRLSQRALVRLAEAGALDGFGYGRREAIWQVRGLARHAQDPLPLTPAPRRVAFPVLRPPEAVAWDFRSSHHSTRGHPMGAYRKALEQRRCPAARELNQMPDGRRVRYVGMVICRQRPGSASGVTFFTLEDETGLVNVVVWRQVFERRALLGKTAKLLGVSGKLQVADGVTHLVADDIFAPELNAGEGDRDALEAEEVAPPSRDFH